MTYEELTELAKRCMLLVKGLDEESEDDAKDALTAGEPIYAIADTLDIAYTHPELYAKFPDEVVELARDPQWRGIHAYLPELERSRTASA